MKKPTIMITATVADNGNLSMCYDYARAIETAGGAPFVVPYIENDEMLSVLVEKCDGVLFTGGVDVDPPLYGEKKRDYCDTVQPKRDDLELRLFRLIENTSLPILAICRGIQLVSIALGGTLYQDIYEDGVATLAHKTTEPRYGYAHEVVVVEGTPLHTLTGSDRMRANTFHHQAIKELGRGLKIMALADDGIIEAVYGEGERYLRAYQWHPERLHYTDEVNMRIFTDFIDACKK